MAAKKKPGIVSAALDAKGSNQGFSLISNERLIRLYEVMLKCRMLEKRIRTQAKRNGIVQRLSAWGKEGTLVGMLAGLNSQDAVDSTQQRFLVEFIQSAFAGHTPLKKILDAASTANGGAGAHPGTEQLGSLIEAARASKAKKNGGIAAAFSFDEPDSHCRWQEALDLAGAQGLPILFVRQRGVLRTSPNSKSKPAKRAISPPMGARCVPAILVDGSDVVAVYRVASEAMTRARKGQGPTLIECVPFQLAGRVKNGPAKPSRVKKSRRPASSDPIVNMEAYLTHKGLFTSKLRSKIVRDFTQELDTAAGIAAIPDVVAVKQASGRDRLPGARKPRRRPGRE
jgi:acetoin:2,6-dichlorophenolindophenol oxidoreductase subunit alpha